MFSTPAVRPMGVLAMKGVSLDRLLAFLDVYDAGGIARAAAGNPVRQSQLSRQISELERALGCELFVKAGRTRVASQAAAELARVVHDLVRGLDDVVAGAGGPVAPLACTLGAGDSVLQWLVLPRLGGVIGAAGGSGIELRATALSSRDVAAALADGSLDLGILDVADVPDRARAELKVAKIGRYELGVASRWKRAAPLAATADPKWRDEVDALGPVALRCDTYPQVMRAVRHGRFRGVVPNVAMLELRGAPGAFSFVPLGETRSTLGVAWRARLDDVRPRLTPVRRALVDVCRQALALLP